MNNNLSSGEKPIIVLGATGRVGNVVANQLLNTKHKIRAVARHPEKLKDLKMKGAEVFAGKIEDRDFLTKVFTNAKAAFVLTPGDLASPDLHEEQRKNNEHIAEAIKHSGLTHIVFLSSWGAELSEKSGTIYGCYLMEKLLNEIPGLNIVHLRSVWFMDNFIYNIGLIKMAGINGLSIDADFPFPCIDSSDIGNVAADYLAHLNFKGKNIHYLQGSRDYTMREVTHILGNSIGNSSLKYIKFPKPVMIQGLKSSGMISDNVAQLLVETNDKINTSVVHAEVRNVNNTTPTTLEEFARNKFVPAYNATPDPSVLKKMQGTFLRFYLYFLTKN